MPGTGLPPGASLRKYVLGQTVVRTTVNREHDGNIWFHTPVLEFSNGVRLEFLVEETEAGEYGVYPLVILPERI